MFRPQENIIHWHLGWEGKYIFFLVSTKIRIAYFGALYVGSFRYDFVGFGGVSIKVYISRYITLNAKKHTHELDRKMISAWTADS